jgi:hypothetical protein
MMHKNYSTTKCITTVRRSPDGGGNMLVPAVHQSGEYLKPFYLKQEQEGKPGDKEDLKTY